MFKRLFVVGATDRLGADVSSLRVGVRDFLATNNRHLGIDAGCNVPRQRTGGPIPVSTDGQPIPGLVGGAERATWVS